MLVFECQKLDFFDWFNNILLMGGGDSFDEAPTEIGFAGERVLWMLGEVVGIEAVKDGKH